MAAVFPYPKSLFFEVSTFVGIDFPICNSALSGTLSGVAKDGVRDKKNEKYDF